MMRTLGFIRGFAVWFVLLLIIIIVAILASSPNEEKKNAAFEQRFLDCTLVGPGSYPLTFNQLNWSNPNGHVVLLGGDGTPSNPKWFHVKEAGNFVGAYYNDLNSPGYLLRTANQKADDIHAYLEQMFDGDGGGGYPVSVPTWVAVNEISNGLWPDNQTYRTWVRGVAARLKQTYGHQVIMLAPFQTALNNSADWTALSGNAYIGVQCYLSGREIRAQNYSVAWCQAQYQASKNSFLARGVPASKIFLTEHFGWSADTTGWGRASVPEADWHQAINARSQAAENVGFAGFVGYGFGSYNEDNFDAPYFDAHQAPFCNTFNNYSLP